MRRIATHAPLALGLGLAVFALVRAFDEAGWDLPLPSLGVHVRHFLFPRRMFALALGAVMFAPLPWSLAWCLWRRRRGPLDAADSTVRHAASLIVIQAIVFACLAVSGRFTLRTLMASQMGACALGTAALVWLLHKEERYPWPELLRWAFGHCVVVVVLCAGGLLSVQMGKDYNNDLLQYHYYNAFALLDGRFHYDLAPANMWTFFNPYADVPFYLLAENLPPAWTGFTVGAVHFVPVILLFALAYRVLERADVPASLRLPLALIATAAGAYEPVSFAELGTSFHDNVLSGLVLAGLLAIANCRSVPGSTALPRWPFVSGGVLIGLAVGLKLTLATYGVAAVVGLIVGVASWRQRRDAVVWFGIGSAAGFLVADGPWAATLCARFGNPVFPFFNNWFRSPYWTPENWSVTGQTAANWIEVLCYPFYFLPAHGRKRALEVPFHDARLAIVYVLAVAAVAAWVIRRWRATASAPQEATASSVRVAPFLLAFTLAGFVIWQYKFQIVRYLCPINMLAPLVAVLLLAGLIGHGRRLLAAAMLACFAVIAWMDVGSYGRIPWAAPFMEAKVPAIEDGDKALLLLSFEVAPKVVRPFGFVTTRFPRGMRFVRLDMDLLHKTLPMHRELKEILARHTGPIYLLTHRNTIEPAQPAALELATERLQPFGLWRPSDDCQRVSAPGFDLGVWRIERQPAAYSGSP